MQGYCTITSRNIYFGDLLESDKYPKHMFYEEITIKQGISYIHVSFCPLRILHNSKFSLMATSLGKMLSL